MLKAKGAVLAQIPASHGNLFDQNLLPSSSGFERVSGLLSFLFVHYFFKLCFLLVLQIPTAEPANGKRKNKQRGQWLLGTEANPRSFSGQYGHLIPLYFVKLASGPQ